MKHRRQVGRALGGAAILTALTMGSVDSEAQDEVSTIEKTRTALTELVDTRRTLSLEKSRWAQEQELLQERIDVAQRKLDSMRELIEATESDIGEADEGVAELESQAQSLEAAAVVLDEPLPGFEERVLALLERVPEPAREEVRFLSQAIPGFESEDSGDGAEGEEGTARARRLSAGQRFQSVIAIMTRLDKFNSALHLETETRRLSTGESAQVKTLYLGLGQGYYVTQDVQHAGVGTATSEAWTWIPMDDAAQAIDQAILVEQNSLPAAFVPLPLRIDVEATAHGQSAAPEATGPTGTEETEEK